MGGYCVVCYQTADKAVKGSEKFSTDYQGKTYYFADQGALDTFKKSPAKYVPEYDGWCAYGVTFGKKIPVDPTVFSVVDGKLYLNKNKKVGKIFEKDTEKNIEKADTEWKKIK